ncbi:MAG TPA: GNAT family N-acetyltransferase [Candidatus Yaniella excrementigallinarum]|nr:GNAT family N-acetyltransferase [Candidatus Yaniella excrementigallinarum]
MLDPTLLPITDGVRSLRLLAEDDAERYIAGTKDPLVQQFGHLPEPEYSSQDVRHLANTVAPSGIERGDLGLLSIIDESGIFLGSLVLFDCTSTSAEVGFWLHPDARGHGHAIGALELAAAFAKQSRLHEITARTVAGNDSSIHVLERAGFEEISREVERTPAGEETPLIQYRRDLIS